MKVIFVHGWSVTNTDTYGELPLALSRQAPHLDIQVEHLYLAKYVSFSDEVTVKDLARGMEAAVQAQVIPALAEGERFACITHSTGGPVVRAWIQHFYADRLDQCPLGSLVMLAPANHGSALAQLGKTKLARMKFFLGGVEPGVGVLNWLELGSEQSWRLNTDWIANDLLGAGIYTFVLTGQSIDRSFYDNLNSYTGEAGSDGVVRVAAANMNYGLLRLEQQGGKFKPPKKCLSPITALRVLPGLSHSGKDMGIMASVRADAPHPTVDATIKCLSVTNARQYRACVKDFEQLTAQTQEQEREKTSKSLFLFDRTFVVNRYFMLVIRIRDDDSNMLNDYDVLFTAGPHYDENHLPKGFFVDRQRNSKSPGILTYYMNYDVMAPWFEKREVEDKFGFKICARPDEGFAHYTLAEHKGQYSKLSQYFRPNQTVMIDVILKRQVMEGVFRLTQNLAPESFKNQAKGSAIE
ncbi:MAG: hypothetical protein LBE22_11220 [Azoarcus sp.]|jgi:hypothetical protein|nr:hypothetical protein [Azoarcus sp.]